jgi:hypothetical protein
MILWAPLSGSPERGILLFRAFSMAYSIACAPPGTRGQSGIT